MKKLTTLFFAAAMMFSVVFIGEAISSNGSLSVNAQQVSVKRKRRGVASRTYRGGKYVYRKSAKGVRYVYRKTAKGTVYVGKQTYRGGKWTYNKGKSGTKYVIRKTKKALY
ncbi:hypothetical protein BH20ACI4_BH20ACI4_32980 [soil metagenome]